MPPEAHSLSPSAPSRPLKKRPLPPLSHHSRPHRRYPRLLTTDSDGRITPIPLILPSPAPPACPLVIPSDPCAPPPPLVFRPSERHMAALARLRHRADEANRLGAAATKTIDYVHRIAPEQHCRSYMEEKIAHQHPLFKGFDAERRSTMDFAEPQARGSEGNAGSVGSVTREGSRKCKKTDPDSKCHVEVKGAGKGGEECLFNKLRGIANGEIAQLEAYSEAKMHISISPGARKRIEKWLKGAKGVEANAALLVVLALDFDPRLISQWPQERVDALKAVENEHLRIFEALMARTENPGGLAVWTLLTKQLGGRGGWKLPEVHGTASSVILSE